MTHRYGGAMGRAPGWGHTHTGGVPIFPTPPGLTQVVRTLAAALSKWKERTLLIPSVISVRT